jgi:tripartite-type tricarboxylate transporter receptor subunit TctC
LAQTSAKRAPTLPEVPTMEDAGYKGLVLEAWYAAFGPAGTPPELVKTINAAIEKAMTDQNLQANFVKGSLESVGGTPEKLDKLAKADSVKYEKLVRELNISVT